MEVILPSSSPDFNFDSACSSPYFPSSPKRFGHLHFSAPSSPTRASSFYREFNNFTRHGGESSSSSVIPYDWEEVPGTPKLRNNTQSGEEDKEEEEIHDFEFGFSGESDASSITAADELFDDGKIKLLKPPPRLQIVPSRLRNENSLSSPKSPRSPIALFREKFSPKKKKQIDPFATAIKGVVEQERERGRERGLGSSSSRKGSRSLSPFRSSGFRQQEQQSTKPNPSNAKSSSKKWSFRDFLLFRSASEGRASERDPLWRFSLLPSKRNEDVKNSSFRSTDSSGSTRRGRVSAHELHYKSNRAVSEEMKRKTVLPYKPHGLFGWFRI